jgi:hypothetical protein
MIALHVEDGYGAHVVVLPLVHEGAAVVDVHHAPNMPDLYFDAHELRDLADVALLAARMLDEAAEVTP